MAEISTPSTRATESSDSDPMAVDYGTDRADAAMETGVISMTDTDHPRPGDPEPINPEPTVPPDGSGDPPLDDPTSPGGPGEPA
jgi:hypothetical protein